ncbi:MAG: nucleotidyltransferase domain-containing protein [Acidilobaceae archaeon]
MSEVEVVYSEERWKLLREKRAMAIAIIKALSSSTIYSIVHGSVARGDVSENSDIDVFVINPVPPLLVELALERAGYKAKWKEIVQATPSSTPKAYIYLDDKGLLVVSLPLGTCSKTEREFYKWGGEASLEDLEKDRRVPGVDKRLMLIEPTPTGHKESPVVGRETYVAKVLNISVETVLERVRVLTRRREHGRTGVFIKKVIDASTPIEEAVMKLSEENQYFRRKIYGL